MKGIKNLCEAIILQSMEDLLEQRAVEENRDFLEGEGLAICASIAGLAAHERMELANLALRAAPRVPAESLPVQEEPPLRLAVNA